jgi:hypothetical protein
MHTYNPDEQPVNTHVSIKPLRLKYGPSTSAMGPWWNYLEEASQTCPNVRNL